MLPFMCIFYTKLSCLPAFSSTVLLHSQPEQGLNQSSSALTLLILHCMFGGDGDLSCAL